MVQVKVTDEGIEDTSKENSKGEPVEQDDAAEAKAAPVKKSRFGWVKKKWVIRIVAVSVLVHALGFGFYWTYYPNPKWTKLGREESLGTFEFENPLTEGIVIKRAVFDVHLPGTCNAIKAPLCSRLRVEARVRGVVLSEMAFQTAEMKIKS